MPPSASSDSPARAQHPLLATTGYLLALFPFAWVAFSLILTLFVTAISMIVLIIGAPVLVGTLMIARGFGSTERRMLRWTGRPVIPPPLWPPKDPQASRTSRLTAVLKSGHHWAHLLHQMLVSPILSTVSFSLTVTWWAGALGGLTYWIWQRFLPASSPESDWPGRLADRLMPGAGWTPTTVETILYTLAGIVFAVTLPAVVRGLGLAHYRIARAMLGRWATDDLATEVRAESAARRAAVQAEDSAMRRLERDLHDGPQQRLVRLQMDLAATRRRVDEGDMDQAARLAGEAQEQAQAALDELRALSRGVAPPLLADRGLVTALTGLAAEAAVPVTTRLDPDIDVALDPDVARAVYFMAAELLTNVAKHAHASHAELSACVRWEAPARLRLTVSDDGVGAGAIQPGHGLEGLGERASGLRGALTLESPPGGPTRVDIVIPMTVESAAEDRPGS